MDVIITPEDGKAAEIVRQLLQLADHPSQVRTVSWPSLGFLVPEELFDKFEAAQAKDTSDVKAKTDDEAADKPKQAPKQRRPRKTSEEK